VSAEDVDVETVRSALEMIPITASMGARTALRSLLTRLRTAEAQAVVNEQPERSE
jgi:hypothetical protein